MLSSLRPLAAVIAASIVTAAPAAQAQAGDDIWAHVINRDDATNWSVSQQRPRPRVVEAPGVPGEQALRVRVDSPGPNPWAVQATAPIAGPIKQGEVVLLMFYARAESAADGGSVLPARIQLAAAPYTALVQSNVSLSAEWAQHCAHAAAAQDFPAGAANVALHLAGARQTIDIGPVFVFNFGAQFDQSRLSDCS